MDRRARIMTVVFGVLITYALVSKVAYPRWVEPMLSIDERLAVMRRTYDKLKSEEKAVERAKRQYKAFVSRVGSLDIGKVENELRDTLNKLIQEHGLKGAKVSPSRPTTDRKTDLEKMVLTVTAVGKLRSVVEFLRDVAELPHLVRVNNPAIYPASSSGRDGGGHRMNLRVPLEVWVLPQQKIVGRLNEEELVRPEIFVRHQDRDYSPIWHNEPFTEPEPVQARAGRDMSVRQGQETALSGSARGGDGEYTYSWSPTERLSDPTIPKPQIDTSSVYTGTYTLTVTDEHGRTAADSVEVTVREPPKTRRRTRMVETPPSPGEVDKRWRDRRYMQLCMTLLHNTSTERVDELMIYNTKAKTTAYYAVKDEFDGGELVFVHPRGGIVRRSDEYFVYPIGATLAEDINVNDAALADYPELKEAADRIRRAAEVELKPAEEVAGREKENLE